LKIKKSNESSNKDILEYIKELFEMTMSVGKYRNEGELEIDELDPADRKNLLKKKLDSNYSRELQYILYEIERKINKDIQKLKKYSLKDKKKLDKLVKIRKDENIKKNVADQNKKNKRN